MNYIIKITFFCHFLFITVYTMNDLFLCKDGLCLPTADCYSDGGTPLRGHCPGPADIQCCTNIPCRFIYGHCDWTTNFCDGGYMPGKQLIFTPLIFISCEKSLTVSHTGHCPGPENFQCCPYRLAKVLRIF